MGMISYKGLHTSGITINSITKPKHHAIPSMGNTDSMPVVSQLKLAVQAVGGGPEGAKRTQKNFLRGCPVISQGTSLLQAIGGDNEAAEETQKYFLKGMEKVANSTPGLGHTI